MQQGSCWLGLNHKVVSYEVVYISCQNNQFCSSNACNWGYNKFWFKSGKEIRVVTLTLEDIHGVIFA